MWVGHRSVPGGKGRAPGRQSQVWTGSLVCMRSV